MNTQSTVDLSKAFYDWYDDPSTMSCMDVHLLKAARPIARVSWDRGRAELVNSFDAMRKALQAAKEHLEYCGYGDKWERGCALESKLAERIEAALALAKGKEGSK